MGVTRFQESATGKDIPVSPDNPMPVTSGVTVGALDDAAWDGATGDPASLIALWKGIMAQLVAINANTAAP